MASASEGRNDPAPIIVKKITVVEGGQNDSKGRKKQRNENLKKQ